MIEHQDKDADVWRRAKQEMTQEATANGAPCRPDALVLAAFLEGNASEAEKRQVELWLAGDPEAATLLRSLRTLPEAVPAPEAVLARAQDIVRAPSRSIKGSGAAWRSGFGDLFAGAGLQWAAAAAMMLLVAVSGFEAGRSGGTALTDTTDYVGLSAEFGELDDALL